MDSITQGVLGAAIGESILGEKLGRKGAALGALIATIPDLDVVLYLFYSKVEMLSIHRGFSHSILFSFLLAILIAYGLKTKSFRSTSFQKLFIFSWLCLFTHILLDTFTAYGTQLLLPFSNKRLGFDSINVVDPVYTVPMIVGLVLSLWVFKSKPKSSVYTKWALAISTSYLLFTLVNKQLVTNAFESNFKHANIEYSKLLTMPVGVANINWYGVAKGEDSLYLQKHSIVSSKIEPIESFPTNDNLLDAIDSTLADKMRWFAKDFYTVLRDDESLKIFNLQVDMRGVTNLNGQKVPTVGYFEIKQDAMGKQIFGSGSVE